MQYFILFLPIFCTYREQPYLYPALTGSKTPTSKFKGSKEVRWGINCP